MLSDRQKSVLFKTRIVSKPRYVRFPLQMYNGVRELKTDERFTCAFRSLNASRIIRRMHITGFRIVDIVGAEKPYVMRSAFCVAAPDFPIGTRPLLFQEQVALRPCQQPVKTVGP